MLMFAQSFMLTEYMPAMKAEQVGKLQDQLAVVDGRNFAWRASGVFSAYENVPAPNAPENTTRHPGAFVIQNVVYVFTGTGVSRRNANNTWTTVATWAGMGLPVAGVTSEWALANYVWSHAYVGTEHWFCHPTVGLFSYDQFTGVWAAFRDYCWSGPVYSICAADNRLVVLLNDVVAWSWFDQGRKFDHLWQSGSGAQSLALIKYGQPYAVRPYNGGFLTFTSMGVMVSQQENNQTMHPEGDRLQVGALVFNHSLVTHDEVCLGPAASCAAGDGLVVWLSQQGFRAFQPTQGGGFGGMAVWQPAMGAFYKEVVVAATSALPSDHFMLSYCREFNAIFMSVRAPAGVGGPAGRYDKAHVFQLDYEKWGSFDKPHRFVGPGFYGALGANNTQLAGFIDDNGALCDITHGPGQDSWVKFSPFRLQLPQEPSLPATTLISVQELRFGAEMALGREVAQHPFGLVSGWEQERFRAVEPTKCDVLISGGWDANTQNSDQGEYAMLTYANAETAVYVCDVTGLTHSVYVECSAPDHHFTISHVEASFFFAGQL